MRLLARLRDRLFAPALQIDDARATYAAALDHHRRTAERVAASLPPTPLDDDEHEADRSGGHALHA
jgi:hypothetical protein